MNENKKPEKTYETRGESDRNCTECPYRHECLDNMWAGGCPIERGIYGPKSW